MAAAAIVAGAGGWLAASQFPDVASVTARFLGNAGKREGVSQSQPQQTMPAGPMFVTLPQGNNGGSSSLGMMCVGAAVAGGAYYLIRYHTKPSLEDTLRPQIEEAQDETTANIERADENAEQRTQQLDRNMDTRMKQLSADVRGAANANFDTLSQQVYCLTQVALQTLNFVVKSEDKRAALTEGTPGAEGQQQLALAREHSQRMMEFAEKVQSASDQLCDRRQQAEKRSAYTQGIRADLGLTARGPQQLAITSGETPGGPATPDGASSPHITEEPDDGVQPPTGTHRFPSRRKRPPKKKSGWVSTLGTTGVGSAAMLCTAAAYWAFYSKGSEPGYQQSSARGFRM